MNANTLEAMKLARSNFARIDNCYTKALEPNEIEDRLKEIARDAIAALDAAIAAAEQAQPITVSDERLRELMPDPEEDDYLIYDDDEMKPF